MRYGIMRMSKLKAEALGGIERENNRTTEINLPKSDIKWSLTKENIHLVKSDNFRSDVKEILLEHGITKHRKDAVVTVDALYTASPDFFKDLTKEEMTNYFRECLAFHRENLGIVYNAVIHLDERTPHMHVLSVPIVDRGEGRFSLSAKDLLGGQAHFRELQDMFYENVSKGWGLERGEIGSDREHLDSLQYKAKQVENELIQIETKKEDAAAKVEELEKKVGKLEKVGEIITSVSDRLNDLFGRVNDFVCSRIDNLLAMVENKVEIAVESVKAAFCSLRHYSCGEGAEKIDLFGIRTIEGTDFSWFGNRPLYTKEDAVLYPAGVMDSANKFIDVDWQDVISADSRDPVSYPYNKDICLAKMDIDEIKELTGVEVEHDDFDYSDFDIDNDPVEVEPDDSPDGIESDNPDW